MSAACSMLLRSPSVRMTAPQAMQRARHAAAHGPRRAVAARGALRVVAAAGSDGVVEKLGLGALRPGIEIVNGRAAMVGFLGIAVNEIATGKSAWAQMGSGGFFTALLLMGAVSAASVAPALTCVRGTAAPLPPSL